MNNLPDKLIELANDLIEEGRVSEADACYEAASLLGMPSRSTKVSELRQSSDPSDRKGDIADSLAQTLHTVISKFVPEDEQEEYIEALIEYEEYVNDL